MYYLIHKKPHKSKLLENGPVERLHKKKISLKIITKVKIVLIFRKLFSVKGICGFQFIEELMRKL
jgi:hypothetical protein